MSVARFEPWEDPRYAAQSLQNAAVRMRVVRGELRQALRSAHESGLTWAEIGVALRDAGLGRHAAPRRGL